MRAVLDHCSDGVKHSVAAGDTIIREGQTSGHLFVLIEGQLDIVKGDTVVASLTDAVIGEMSVLLEQPHTATVRAVMETQIYEFENATDFLRDHPTVALMIARLLAQRLHVATSYLADIKQQYAGHGTHLSMVSELLDNMVNLSPTKVSPGSDRHSDRQGDPRI